MQIRGSEAKRRLAWILVALAAASVLYHLLLFERLEQTSLLFIGIPLLIGMLTIFSADPRTAKGLLFKQVTLGLLFAGAFLGEGFVCIVMSAPIFYLVAAVVAAGSRSRQPDGEEGGEAGAEGKRRTPLLAAIVGLALVPASLEGTRPAWSFDRAEQVSVEQVVAGAPEQVEAALESPPAFPAPLPAFLRLGFPRPVAATGEGLRHGALRTIRFAGGEGEPGDLVLEVVERAPGRVVFAARADGSKIAHWLAWRTSRVEWTQEGAGRTRVRWTIQFTRRLDPAWYFAPVERYAVRLAAAYLIETQAAPRR